MSYVVYLYAEVKFSCPITKSVREKSKNEQIKTRQEQRPRRSKQKAITMNLVKNQSNKRKEE